MWILRAYPSAWRCGRGLRSPDVSTIEAFRQILLKAKTVAVPGSTSGIWLATDLFPRLGIAEQINVRVMPRGTDATAMVAAGGADFAVLPVSEIVHAAGVDFAGSIAAGDPVRAGLFCRCRCRLGRDRRFQATD